MTKLADAIHFDYIEELCEEVLCRLDVNEDIYVSVIGKYEEIKTFIKEFMKYEDIDFDCIDIHNSACDDYDKEFIVDITNIDGNISFYCVPCYADGRYFKFDGDVLYLLEDTKQSVLHTCEYDEIYFVIIGEDECDCDEECDGCCACGCCNGNSCVEYSKTDNGDIHGFSASRTDDKGYYSYSFYTSDTLSKGDIHGMLKEFGFKVYRNLK